MWTRKGKEKTGGRKGGRRERGCGRRDVRESRDGGEDRGEWGWIKRELRGARVEGERRGRRKQDKQRE